MALQQYYLERAAEARAALVAAGKDRHIERLDAALAAEAEAAAAADAAMEKAAASGSREDQDAEMAAYTAARRAETAAEHEVTDAWNAAFLEEN